MHILITGGTGLIGQHFISQYHQHQYTVLTRSISTVSARGSASIHYLESLETLAHLDAYDAVINLAGEPIMGKRWSEAQKTRINESRWQVTQRLVDLFARSRNPPKVFLSGSAVGVYGNRDTQILNEASVVQEHDFTTRLCLRWEAIARQAEPYTRVVLLRTGIVLAPQGGALAKMCLPFKLGLGGRISKGCQYMSWIHYYDLCRAMQALLMDHPVSGAVNLVAPEPVTNRVFTQTLAQSLRRYAILPMPKKVLQSVLGESSCLLLDSQRVMPQALLDDGFTFCFAKLRIALMDVLRPLRSS